MRNRMEWLRRPWRREAPSRKRPIPELSVLPREEADRARRRLDQLERTCACGFSVAGAWLTFAPYAAGVAYWFDLTANNAWALGGIGFAVLIVGAVLGKIFGLTRARIQRDRLLDELYSRVATLGASP
jgi:hypothetical protein